MYDMQEWLDEIVGLSLYGESGLKFPSVKVDGLELTSLSVWREWIEMRCTFGFCARKCVSLCMERVD